MKKLKALRNKKGFTLIELLTVIAILGILVLLAAPKFLGYTAQANVAAMKADAKMLSNSAMIYSAEQEIAGNTGAWPVLDTTANAVVGDFDGDGVEETGYKLATSFTPDGGAEAITVFKDIKNTKNDLTKYILVTEGDNAGEVFHASGVKDKNQDLQFGVEDVKYNDAGAALSSVDGSVLTSVGPKTP